MNTSINVQRRKAAPELFTALASGTQQKNQLPRTAAYSVSLLHLVKKYMLKLQDFFEVVHGNKVHL